MNGVDIYGRYGNTNTQGDASAVSPNGGLSLINNVLSIQLDPNPFNDLFLSSAGLLHTSVIVSPNGGLVSTNNNLSILLDPSTNNDLSISSAGLLHTAITASMFGGLTLANNIVSIKLDPRVQNDLLLSSDGIYHRGNTTTSTGGLSIDSDNALSILLDPSTDNDLSLSSNGLLGNGLKIDGTNTMRGNLNVGVNNVLIGDLSGGVTNQSAICIKQDGQLSNSASASIFGLKFYNSTSNDGYYMGYTMDGYFGIYNQTNAGMYRKLIDVGSDSTYLYSLLTMSGNRITGLSLPISYNDAATKGYVDTLSTTVAVSGGLSITSPSVLSIQLDPSSSNDLTLSSSGLLHTPLVDTLGGLSVNGNSLSIKLDPRVDNDLMLTSEGLIGTGLKTDGSSQMSANINMNTNQINNLTSPVNANDACTKGYTDNLVEIIFTHLIYSVENQTITPNPFTTTVNLNTTNLFVIKVNSSAGSRPTTSHIFKLDPTIGTMLTYLPIPLYVGLGSLLNQPILQGFLNILFDKTSNLLQIYFVNAPDSTITSYSLYIYFAT